MSFEYTPQIRYLNYPDLLPCWPHSSVGRAPVDLIRRSWVQTPLGPNFLWPVGPPKFNFLEKGSSRGGFGVSTVMPTTSTLTIYLNNISTWEARVLAYWAINQRKRLIGDHRNEEVGTGKCLQGGHVTPSFRTDDKIEFQSNINLQVSSRLINI